MKSHFRSVLQFVIFGLLLLWSFSSATAGRYFIVPVAAQGSCALPNYPDASCTGVPSGTALTVVSGNMSISTANAVVDSKDIRGCVTVTAPGVVIKNSKITCSNGVYAIDTYQVTGTWLTIQDSTI